MEKIKLKNVRLSFPSLFKPAVFNGNSTGKYEATFLIPKNTEQATMVEKALEKFIQETFKDKVPKGLKRTCLRDGDEVEYDGYAGMLALKAGTSRRPLVLDSDKTPLTEEDNRIYPGCYVNAIVDFWYSDHNLGGKQILGNLSGVMFHKDGESFGSSSTSIDEFDDFDDDDDSF